MADMNETQEVSRAAILAAMGATDRAPIAVPTVRQWLTITSVSDIKMDTFSVAVAALARAAGMDTEGARIAIGAIKGGLDCMSFSVLTTTIGALVSLGFTLRAPRSLDIAVYHAVGTAETWEALR